MKSECWINEGVGGIGDGGSLGIEGWGGDFSEAWGGTV